MEDIQKSYDAVYISIGAHNDKKIGIEGEDAENVVSAVSLLRRIDEGNAPDFTGKRICVIGGGNVSMWPPERQNVWERKASPVYTVAVWMI